MAASKRHRVFKAGTTRSERIFGIVTLTGLVMLFLGFGLMVYRRFGTSIGMMGMYNRALDGVALLLGGVSFLCFGSMLIMQMKRKDHVPLRVIAREFEGIGLGFVAYVLPFFLVMGAIGATDSMGASGFVLAAAFAAIPFFYRRYRKQHPIVYTHTGNVAIALMVLFLAAAGIAGGASVVNEATSDLRVGYKQDTFAVFGLDINRPSRRAALLTPVTYELDLYRTQEDADAHEPTGRISISEADWPEVERVLGTEDATCTLRWYPNAQVMVGARDNGTGATVGDPI